MRRLVRGDCWAGQHVIGVMLSRPTRVLRDRVKHGQRKNKEQEVIPHPDVAVVVQKMDERKQLIKKELHILTKGVDVETGVVLQEMVEREQRKNKEREAEKAEKAKAASNASSSSESDSDSKSEAKPADVKA